MAVSLAAQYDEPLVLIYGAALGSVSHELLHISDRPVLLRAGVTGFRGATRRR